MFRRLFIILANLFALFICLVTIMDSITTKSGILFDLILLAGIAILISIQILRFAFSKHYQKNITAITKWSLALLLLLVITGYFAFFSSSPDTKHINVAGFFFRFELFNFLLTFFLSRSMSKKQDRLLKRQQEEIAAIAKQQRLNEIRDYQKMSKESLSKKMPTNFKPGGK
ncbi:hypothetical protein [Vagococcus sp.]|uniref:hypothetical protein n=1 Tax=Vagococcus sp. TaxID=1933889 RepID=UPI003F97E6FC